MHRHNNLWLIRIVAGYSNIGIIISFIKVGWIKGQINDIRILSWYNSGKWIKCQPINKIVVYHQCIVFHFTILGSLTCTSAIIPEIFYSNSHNSGAWKCIFRNNDIKYSISSIVTFTYYILTSIIKIFILIPINPDSKIIFIPDISVFNC